MTRWCGLLAVGIVLAVGVACSDEGEETGSTATGGSGGSATGGTTSGGTGGTGGAPSGGTGGTAGSGGSAGSVTDAAAGSGGGSVGDAATDATLGDGSTTWPDVLFSGVWFAGWAGGLDHFSWMKFTQSGQTNGQWAALDSVCTSCTGYFSCEGNDGLFSASSSPQTLTLQYPQSCTGATGEDWTILGFESPPSFPPGALLQMNIQVGSVGVTLQAFLYPASQCNAGFTSCTNPF